MLSEKQQEIINSLTSEFNKMNQTSNVSSGLINIGGITTKFQAEQNDNKEYALLQETWKKTRQEEAKKIAEILNVELKPIGLKAVIPSNLLDMVKITLDGEKHVCYTKEINIYIENKYKGHNEFGNKIIVGMSYEFYENPNSRVRYDNIKEITTHKSFDFQIKTLYALTEPQLA